MKVCVINGSPKGKYSLTFQTVCYLREVFSNCEFEILHVGQNIKQYEKDISPCTAAIEGADLVLFAYPVYTFIAPYQLHRFIELMKQSMSLHGKLMTQITTSKHFYDVTAHKYVEQNCADMGMRIIGGLSADMDDLLTEQGQGDAIRFWQHVMFCAENGVFKALHDPIPQPVPVYTASCSVMEKTKPYTVALLTNSVDDSSLDAMVSDFCALMPCKVEVINIAKYPFKGGCLGCFRCAADGKCIHTDGFDSFLREKIQVNDAIVFAFTIRDHSMGASFKRYDDRQFCNGHRTVTMGMPMGYIVHGDYDAESNLQMVVEGRCEVGHNYLSGVATDKIGLETLSKNLIYALDNGFVLPQNFYGVGGMKIFRDLIYLMRGMMRADHKFYKQHGMYDFPQKKRGTMMKMKLVGVLLNNKKLLAKMGSKMNEGMIAPYRKVVDSAKNRNLR